MCSGSHTGERKRQVLRIVCFIHKNRRLSFIEISRSSWNVCTPNGESPMKTLPWRDAIWRAVCPSQRVCRFSWHLHCRMHFINPLCGLRFSERTTLIALKSHFTVWSSHRQIIRFNFKSSLHLCMQTILSADAFRFFRSTYHLHISLLLFRIGFPLEFHSGWIIIHYYSISFRASLTEILRFIIRFLTRPFADTSQWEVLTDTFSSVALSTHLASIRLTRLTNSKLTLR